jgi:hypothetical protein
MLDLKANLACKRARTRTKLTGGKQFEMYSPNALFARKNGNAEALAQGKFFACAQRDSKIVRISLVCGLIAPPLSKFISSRRKGEQEVTYHATPGVHAH